VSTDRPGIGEIVDTVLCAREELVRSGVWWIEADYLTGVALGTMLAGGGR
jgi:hypothetical protein